MLTQEKAPIPSDKQRTSNVERTSHLKEDVLRILAKRLGCTADNLTFLFEAHKSNDFYLAGLSVPDPRTFTL